MPEQNSNSHANLPAGVTKYIRYRFEREPTPKRFVAVVGTGQDEERVYGEVNEGESLSEGFRRLRSRLGDAELGERENAYWAGYMVGVWDARNGRVRE